MSGPVNIGSAAEWQSLLSDTNVVVADCTSFPAYVYDLTMEAGLTNVSTSSLR